MIPRVLSGVKPTGTPHIGNYLGALANWVRIQYDYESIFCIVDLHAITDYQDPAELRARIRELAAVFLAVGIDPNHSKVVIQSTVAAHSELAWLLTCLTPVGWLARCNVPGSLSHSATTRASAHSLNPGRWLASAIPPLPMIPMRMTLMAAFLSPAGTNCETARPCAAGPRQAPAARKASARAAVR